MKQLVIFGKGGFAGDIYAAIDKHKPNEHPVFMVDDEYYSPSERNTLPFSQFDIENHEVLVAVADPEKRRAIVEKFPSNTTWGVWIDPGVNILGLNVRISPGSILCAGTILTRDIVIGKHAHLNLLTTIGHGCTVGDFFTTSPGVKVGGDCTIGDNVFIGSNAAIKEKIDITENVYIGMLAGVTKNITEPGVYIGTPARKIK
tara:strand:- start:300 stop:905 length:606 start_codon:yes stop_codon:yes gene_type:complete